MIIDELFVSTPPFLLPLLAKELEALQIAVVRKSPAGLFVPKKMEYVYKINYSSRVATRVLWPLAYFPCRDRHELYDGARRIRWHEYLTPQNTFAIDANVSSPTLRHSLFAAQVVKDALCDHFREKEKERPSVHTSAPDLQINLFIHNNNATIAFDTSGAPLYKRGWRKEGSVAPLQESLASALLQLANFSPEEIFCDPFCGGGTLLIEAAMLATHTPSGFFRKKWGFSHHPLFNQKEWEQIKQEADKKRLPLEKGKILGADKDQAVVEICKQNLQNAGFLDAIEVITKDIRSYFPAPAPTLIVSNPPYGKRLSLSEDLFRHVGHFLKTRCAKNWRAYLLSPTPEPLKATELPFKHLDTFSNGGEEVSFFYAQQS